MLSQIGLPGLIILLAVMLVAFGSKNLPTIGRSVGKSLKEFKEGFDESNNLNIQDSDDDIKPKEKENYQDGSNI